jgi:hypothetical protein
MDITTVSKEAIMAGVLTVGVSIGPKIMSMVFK